MCQPFTVESISAHPRIDFETPAVDPASQTLAVLHALAAQPVDHAEAPYAMMTKDAKGIVRIERLQMLRDSPHRNQLGPLDLANGVLLRFPNVD